MTIALLINPVAGNNFDGVTFAGADDFDYERESQGYFVATSTTGGDIGVFDLMAMLQKINEENGNIFDRPSAEAGSSAALTDLILERVLVDIDDTNGILIPTGTHSPPTPNAPNGVRLFETPRTQDTETPTWKQRGGTGIQSGAFAEDTSHFAGCVLLPTAMRFFIGPIMGAPTATAIVWLAPFANAAILPALCCCSFPTPQYEAQPPPPPP